MDIYHMTHTIKCEISVGKFLFKFISVKMQAIFSHIGLKSSFWPAYE